MPQKFHQEFVKEVFMRSLKKFCWGYFRNSSRVSFITFSSNPYVLYFCIIEVFSSRLILPGIRTNTSRDFPWSFSRGSSENIHRGGSLNNSWNFKNSSRKSSNNFFRGSCIITFGASSRNSSRNSFQEFQWHSSAYFSEIRPALCPWIPLGIFYGIRHFFSDIC